jgi:hypothetical protein
LSTGQSCNDGAQTSGGGDNFVANADYIAPSTERGRPLRMVELCAEAARLAAAIRAHTRRRQIRDEHRHSFDATSTADIHTDDDITDILDVTNVYQANEPLPFDVGRLSRVLNVLGDVEEAVQTKLGAGADTRSPISPIQVCERWARTYTFLQTDCRLYVSVCANADRLRTLCTDLIDRHNAMHKLNWVLLGQVPAIYTSAYLLLLHNVCLYADSARTYFVHRFVHDLKSSSWGPSFRVPPISPHRCEKVFIVFLLIRP